MPTAVALQPLASGLRVISAVDVDVHAQVHVVKMVARGQGCPKPKQLRERDVIARHDFPNRLPPIAGTRQRLGLFGSVAPSGGARFDFAPFPRPIGCLGQ